MRKVLISLTVIMSVLLVGYGFSYAISGQCANCHTMHASQNGSWIGDPDITKHRSLLKFGCQACHTGSTGEKNGDAPIVYHTTAPTGQGNGKTLAGGDFYWVTQVSGDNKGHNVEGVGSVGEDQLIGNNAPGFVPPGWDATATSVGYTFGAVAPNGWTQQVTCAGEFGCHGKHGLGVDIWAGVSGGHHGNIGGTASQVTTPATTVGGSYRFLNGITGLEDANWNWGENASTHNEYSGVNDTSARNTEVGAGDYAGARTAGTISFLCAECHGRYHASIASGATGASPWLRHPTDVVLPGDASKEYSNYTAYSVQAPIARPDLTSIADHAVVVPGTDIVMCLSCHRAHGSDQPDLLRWDYSGMVAGTTGGSAGTGCFVCHRNKDGV